MQSLQGDTGTPGQPELHRSSQKRRTTVIELSEGGVIDDEVLFSEEWSYFES